MKSSKSRCIAPLSVAKRIRGNMKILKTNISVANYQLNNGEGEQELTKSILVLTEIINFGTYRNLASYFEQLHFELSPKFAAGY